MKEFGQYMVWLFSLIAFIGGLVLFMMGYGEGLVPECKRRSLESLRQEIRTWIVTRLTKSRHPHSDTAIPDGTPVSKIEYWGNTSELLRDMAFYTELEGGIAYAVHFDRYCGFEIAVQRCPKRRCQIGDIVR